MAKRNFVESGDEERSFERTKRRARFDDDFRGLPRTTTRTDGIKDLRFFTEGDRVLTAVDKQVPEIELLLKSADIKGGMKNHGLTPHGI